MNDPEGFLSRWSRKKREAEKESDKTDHSRESGNPESEALDSSSGLTRGSRESERSESAPTVDIEKTSEQDPELDLTKLPSLDEITADTDIRPFLARGVPASLRQAALRRMWVADPKIRDFIGIAENQWDFTVQGATPGFDLAPPTGDVARMVAGMFGPKSADASASENERKESAAPEAAAEKAETSLRDQIGVNTVEVAARDDADPGTAQTETVRRTQIAKQDRSSVAPQQDGAAQQETEPAVRRSHGGAMPK